MIDEPEGTCDFGTPYSLAEAKAIVKNHRDKMDPYHWEMMKWLVAQLEAANEWREEVDGYFKGRAL